MSRVKQVVRSIAFLGNFWAIQAWPHYAKRLPNGDILSKECGAFGHGTCAGSPERNSFGQDFESTLQYTGELCRKDSDGDGLTNGDEMGDPCCMWRSTGLVPGSESLFTSTDLSLPGDASSKSSRSSCSVQPAAIAQVDLEAGAEKVLLMWSSEKNPTCVCRSSLRIRLKVPGKEGLSEREVVLGWGARQVVLCPSELPEIMGATELSINVMGHNLHSSVDGPDVMLAIERSSTEADRLPCSDLNATILAMPIDPPPEIKPEHETEAGVAAVLVCLLLPLVTYVTLKCIATPQSALYSKLFRPWLHMDLTLGNALAFAILLGGFVAFIRLHPIDTDIALSNTFGSLAGLIGGLPFLWARFGRTYILKWLDMSLEYSWRIHAFLGFFFMVTALVHGVLAIKALGMEYVMESFFNLCGLIAGILMFVGSEFATLHTLMPKLVKYDLFKLMHFLAPLGYIFTLIHLMDKSVPLLVVNLVCLLLWIAAKVQDVMRARTCTITHFQEIDDDYITLGLAKEKFACNPGQWIRLSIPGRAVAHPFTVVPSLGSWASNGKPKDDSNFRLIIRTGAEDTFTGRLRAKAKSGELQSKRVHVAGPYGEGFPTSLNSMVAIAFVVGGVGVTPALSLIPALLRRTPAPEVRLLWFVRTDDIVQECMPYLQMLPENHCTIISGRTRCRTLATTAQGCQTFGKPLSTSHVVRNEKLKVGDWMQATSAEFTKAGHGTAGVFVCGPPSLSKDAWKCSTQGSFQWHFHAETFRFLLG